MNIGMLWFDNDTETSLTDRIIRAAEYYEEKYGRPPTLCYLHHVMLANNELTEVKRENQPRITVRGHTMVLPAHFWMGVE